MHNERAVANLEQRCIQKSLVWYVVERPKAARTWGVRRGHPPLHEGGVCAPSPEFFFHFGPQNGQFRCIVGANFYSSAACVNQQTQYG